MSRLQYSESVENILTTVSALRALHMLVRRKCWLRTINTENLLVVSILGTGHI